MDHMAERVLLFDAYFINRSTVDVPHYIVQLFNEKSDQCSISRKGVYRCYHIVATSLVSPSVFWPYNNGVLPRDVPECGFTDDECWTAWNTISVVVAIFILFAIVVGSFIAYRLRLKSELEKTTWRILRNEIRVTTNDSSAGKSSTVYCCAQLQQSLKTIDTFDHSSLRGGRGVEVAIVRNTIPASLQRYTQHQHIVLRGSQLAQLNEVKKINHDNLSHFVGMCYNQGTELITLWSLEKRGQLQDLLFDDNFELDLNFKTSFVKDVVKGLDYLHSSPVGIHGRLSTVSCKVASHWAVKLQDFGVRNVYADMLARHEISHGDTQEATLDVDKFVALTGFYANELLQFAPELLRPLRQLSDVGEEIPVVRGTVKGDIYSLGMVIYQILYRKEPYDDHCVSGLLEKILKSSGQRALRPKIPENADVNSKVLALFEMCWSEEPEERPATKRIRSIIDSNMKGKGNVVDHMMKMMEQYANNLESLVKERTSMLEEAQKRADTLLSNMLPKSVVEELKAGRQVAPTMYDGATVLFTDLVGFTTLCSASTPLQIVTLLNELYTEFDSLIAIRDCYKVETIGDAYMVVSGIPTPNGNKHVNEAAELAIGMLEAIRTFRVPHKPGRKLEIRIGFHSGSVAAGVVGLATPRYCLFGDTVNMASRMESNGEPMKIQISENAKQLLVTHYPQFITTERGVIPIKGKGECRTFWLISQVTDAEQRHNYR